MSSYLAYIDVETTGLNFYNDAIWQFGILIEDMDTGKVIDAANIKIKPHNIERITPELYELLGKTKEELLSYQSREEGFNKLLSFLEKYTDFSKREDGIIVCGYNIAGFDMHFIRKLFNEEFRHRNINVNNIFDYHVIDVLCLSQLYVLTGNMNGMEDLINVKLKTVCLANNIEFDDAEAHDAMYDIVKTRELFKVLSDKVSFN